MSIRQPIAKKVGLFAVACAIPVYTNAGTHETLRRSRVEADRNSTPVHDPLDRPNVRVFQPVSSIQVENVRLEAAPAEQAPASAVLKFEVLNVSSQRLTDVLLEISVTEKPKSDYGRARARALVRPFVISGNVVLESGYTINYELLLRNLSSNCSCVANVTVRSVRALPDTGL
jgi:hypothetical protein